MAKKKEATATTKTVAAATKEKTTKAITAKVKPIELTAYQRLRIIELRRNSTSFAQIAGVLGLKRTQVIREIKALMEQAGCRQITTRTTERSVEVQRIETALEGLREEVCGGSIPAIDRWLKLCESRRQLLALNRKEKSNQANVAGGQSSLKEYIGFNPDEV